MMKKDKGEFVMSKIIYDFDKGVERRGTDAKKYDPSLCPEDVLPFWIADTDFPSPVEGFGEKKRT